MNKAHILLIDDDQDLCLLIQKLFINNGYICLYALKYSEALDLIKYIKFNALIIDYMMPEKNGIEVIEALKEQNINIPSLMLTAVSETENTINALTAGAYDYVTKPFNSQELLLRVAKLISRPNASASQASGNLIKAGELTFDKITKTLTINKEEIALSFTEIELCNFFFEHINQEVSREDILRYLGKSINEYNIKSLGVSIMRLRKKIEPNQEHYKYLKTIRNKGFMLCG